MFDLYGGALLYLVPVVVAGIVAFVVTRPDKGQPEAARRRSDPEDRIAPVIQLPSPRVAGGYPSAARRAPRVLRGDEITHPTLLHAALSSHLAAVSRANEAFPPAARAARLVSIRKPARIPRRPVHRCPRT